MKACVHPLKTSDVKFKHKSGFNFMFLLIAFILIVCNGSFIVMQERVTNLTWFEAWFLYFEWAYGQSNIAIKDLEAVFDTSKRTICRIVDAKLKKCCTAWLLWPKYASLSEDKKFEEIFGKTTLVIE